MKERSLRKRKGFKEVAVEVEDAVRRLMAKGELKLPSGWNVEALVSYLIWEDPSMSILKRGKSDLPSYVKDKAWVSTLMKKIDRAFKAFERVAEVVEEDRKKRIAKAESRVKFYSEEDTLFGKGTVPFDYKRLIGKARVYTQEEVTEALQTVPDLISNKEDAMKFVKDALRLTRDLPKQEAYKKIIESVKALKEGLEKGKSVQDIKESDRRHLAQAYPGQWGEGKEEPEEDEKLSWLEEQREEEEETARVQGFKEE